MGTKSRIQNCYPPKTDFQFKAFESIVNMLRYTHGYQYKDIKEFFADAIGEAIIDSDWDGYLYELDSREYQVKSKYDRVFGS